MKLSYLITVSSETDTLDRLLNRLTDSIRNTNDEVVILSDIPPSKATLDIINHYIDKPGMWINGHELNNDYGAHKNYGNEQCSGDWIFQIDGDELPSFDLLENIGTIIESNEVELIYVPRINDFKGVTEEHAKQWGWRLTESPTYKRPIVNFPDYQGRIYKKDTSRIKWDRKLHEKIVGHLKYSFLDAEEGWALYHDKTIEKQLETNLRYNKVFTEADNKGHTVL